MTFQYSNSEEFNEAVIYTVTIDDTHCQSIFIGTVSGGTRGPAPDDSAYAVDRPVWTGITYYKPIGGYRIRATNPLAPF